MISVSVDVATHAHAVDLMHVLDGFHPWTVELAHGDWVVVARAEHRERVDFAMTLVSRWAADKNLGPLSFRAADDVPER